MLIRQPLFFHRAITTPSPRHHCATTPKPRHHHANAPIQQKKNICKFLQFGTNRHRGLHRRHHRRNRRLSSFHRCFSCFQGFRKIVPYDLGLQNYMSLLSLHLYTFRRRRTIKFNKKIIDIYIHALEMDGERRHIIL